jgi:signal transduction histidine kinase
VQRQQTKWVVFGLTAAMTGFVLLLLLPPNAGAIATLAGETGNDLFFLFIPISLAIAILRYRLWDIDIIINRALVYGALTASVAGLYILVVGYLGALFRTGGNLLISLLATGLVAVLFQPLRGWLQRSVNRLMYGRRDEPYAVIARLGRRLESSLAPEAVLPTIVETVAQALKLPYAAITWQQDGAEVTAATFGKAVNELLRLPLNYQGEQIGELMLAPRGPGESFTPADRALLSDLARQAGVAAHAVRLTTDLQRLTGELQQSRIQLVSAREEERRRLRRDLHDGLGPQLASLTLKLETARNKLAHDPLADRLLADLTSRTQTAVADIRRLVYALRPPALDELGLLSALREQALQYSQQGQSPLLITCQAPESLPPLPAAIEVALYRIAQEALTNVVRHARADQCHLRLVLDAEAGVLSLEIQDNGCGLPPTHRRGVGLTSMRERAEELGGTWVIEAAATGGTRILVRFPFLLPETGEPPEHQRLSLIEEEDTS